MRESIVDPSEENSSDGDLRALGKIRLEDIEAQEIINALVKEFEKFGQKSKEVKRENVSEEKPDSFDVEKDVKLAGNVEESRLDDTLSEKLLRLFREFCERFVERDISDDKVKTPYSTEKRRKKLIVEALLNMLKKLSLSSREKNLRDLLDEQIENLQKALETEQNSLVRKAMQERLGALLQLRMNLARMKDIGPGAKLTILLLQCALVEGYISASSCKFQDVAAERAMYLSRGMGKLMDVGDIEYRSVRGEMGSIAASYCGHLAAFDRGAAALDNGGISAMARSFSVLDGIGISKAERVLVAGQTVENAMQHGLQPENMLLARLVRVVDNLIGNVVNQVTKAVANVVQDVVHARSQAWLSNIAAREGARSTAPREGVRSPTPGQQEREARNNRGSDTAQGRDSQHSPHAATSTSSANFHIRSHIQCKIDGERIERTECRETRGVSFVDVDYGTYFVRSIVCTYQNIVEKVSTYLGNSPSSELSAISVERVQQNQVVVETQIMSR